MVGWLVPLDPAHSIPAEASTNCFVGAGQKLSPTFLKHLKGCYQSLWAFECYWDINSYFNHFFYESFPLSSQLLSDSAPNSIFRTPVDFVPCWLILLPRLHSEIRAGAQCTDTMWPGLCPPPSRLIFWSLAPRPDAPVSLARFQSLEYSRFSLISGGFLSAWDPLPTTQPCQRLLASLINAAASSESPLGTAHPPVFTPSVPSLFTSSRIYHWENLQKFWLLSPPLDCKNSKEIESNFVLFKKIGV